MAHKHKIIVQDELENLTGSREWDEKRAILSISLEFSMCQKTFGKFLFQLDVNAKILRRLA